MSSLSPLPPLEVTPTAILAVLVASVVWVAVLAVLHFLGRRSLNRQRVALERDKTGLQRQIAQLEKEQSFYIDFLRQFPTLCEKLTSRLTMRDLPAAIAEILERIFDPALAVVVFRRKGSPGERDEQSRFFVVASAPRDAAIKPGTEIHVGQGELGFTLESQRAMSHEDFLRESSSVSWRARTQRNPLSGIHLDLAAPLQFADEIFGAIAVAGVTRRSAQAREVIRLIAQMAALTYYNVAAYRQMKRSAEHDRLTNILNKVSITRQLSHEIVQAEQRKTTASILLFDIDNFKHYNDSNGHLNGDKLLTTLAEQVSSMIRNEDSFGRFGGEEFLLVMPETDRSGAMVVAEKLRRLITTYPFAFAETQPLGFISVSGGVAIFPDDARDSTGLLRLADEALYTAKSQGRNRILHATTATGSTPR